MQTYTCPRCKKIFQKQDLFLMCSDCGYQFSTKKIKKIISISESFRYVRKTIFPLLIIAIIVIPIYFFATNCKIGTITENGGIIFFDKMRYSDGWRYLEVAPVRIPATVWSETENIKILGELESDLGKGDRNSYTIINRFGAKSASYKALNYGEEWYLGNCKEMKLLNFFSNIPFLTRNTKKIEGFEPLLFSEEEIREKKLVPFYWTSEVPKRNKAYSFDFSQLYWRPQEFQTVYEEFKDGSFLKAEKCFVRPIRKF